MMLVDGRQSEIAAAVSQGVRRLFRSSGISSVCEFTLNNGRRADIAGIGPNGLVYIVEIKSSIQDLRSDNKWTDYIGYCDFFHFAAPPELDPGIFPENAGLIAGDSYGAEVVRAAQEAKIGPARRRSILLDFAHHAAGQLHALHDPQFTL
ncbi:MAG: MmcB family DNA repair protein [Beijerinckiaceae bacterium]|jgi:hypothetical protein|nr:MmcB family DNA repair protein [Beijerinckiaceae bacterium]